MGPVMSRAAPRIPSKVFGATSDRTSRINPMTIPAMTPMKLKNSPYCARRDQPGRAVATLTVPLRGLQDAAELLFLQRPASAEGDAGQRIVGDRDRKAGLVAQHLVEAL